jgi:hypothetical protein
MTEAFRRGDRARAYHHEPPVGWYYVIVEDVLPDDQYRVHRDPMHDRQLRGPARYVPPGHSWVVDAKYLRRK